MTQRVAATEAGAEASYSVERARRTRPIRTHPSPSVPGRRTWLVALAALVALTGCISGVDTTVEERAVPAPDQPVDDGGALDPVPMPPPGELPRVDDDEMEPHLVEVQPEAEDPRVRDWTEVYVLDGGTMIELRWWGGVEPCHVVAGVDVDQGEDLVTVTLMEGTGPTPDGEDVACIDIARYTAVRVPLDEPVGDRSIVDGADG